MIKRFNYFLISQEINESLTSSFNSKTLSEKKQVIETLKQNIQHAFLLDRIDHKELSSLIEEIEISLEKLGYRQEQKVIGESFKQKSESAAGLEDINSSRLQILKLSDDSFNDMVALVSAPAKTTSPKR